jgi:hypothetical protein
MKRIVLASSLVLITAAPAFAGPKDQSANTMVATQSLNGNAVVNNFSTAISVKSKGCPLQLAMKGLSSVGNGDLLICIAEADVIAPPALPSAAGNSVVLALEVSKGSVKGKINLAEIGCGGQDSVSFNSDLKCYLDDGVFLGSDPATNWRANCLAAGMIAADNPAASPAKLKLNPNQNIVVGLCQGLSQGQRIVPPTSLEIARQGGLVR